MICTALSPLFRAWDGEREPTTLLGQQSTIRPHQPSLAMHWDRTGAVLMSPHTHQSHPWELIPGSRREPFARFGARASGLGLGWRLALGSGREWLSRSHV